jgi:hypothetical protein
MRKRSFFTFALGTAAVAVGAGLVKKNGGLHVSFDITPSKLGESLTQWRARRDEAITESEPEEHGEAESGEN